MKGVFSAPCDRFDCRFWHCLDRSFNVECLARSSWFRCQYSGSLTFRRSDAPALPLVVSVVLVIFDCCCARCVPCLSPSPYCSRRSLPQNTCHKWLDQFTQKKSAALRGVAGSLFSYNRMCFSSQMDWQLLITCIVLREHEWWVSEKYASHTARNPHAQSKVMPLHQEAVAAAVLKVA